MLCGGQRGRGSTSEPRKRKVVEEVYDDSDMPEVLRMAQLTFNYFRVGERRNN